MNYSIGFIGCGNMAKAIISAIQNNSNAKINVFDVNPQQTACINSTVKTYLDCQSMIDASDVVFIAVKPQVFREATAGLRFKNKIVVSIMASITVETIRAGINHSSDKIVRVMPNMNAKFSCAFSGYTQTGLTAREIEFIEEILGYMGEFAYVSENQLNAVTGVAGSGPAFVYKFIKALAAAGVSNGLGYEDALNMALTTVIGSCYAVKNSENPNLEQMISAVCSKGGTTIAGINVLNKNCFEDTVMECVNAAVTRAEEMSKENERSNDIH